MREAQAENIGEVRGRALRTELAAPAGVVVVLTIALIVGVATFTIWLIWPRLYYEDVRTVGEIQRFDLPETVVSAALDRIGMEGHVLIARYSDMPRDWSDERTIGFGEATSAYHAAQVVLLNTRREVVPPPNASVTTLYIVDRTEPVPESCRKAFLSPAHRPTLSEIQMFNIPEASLDLALTCWSAQSGIPAFIHRVSTLGPVEFRDLLVRLKSREVTGEMSALRALQRLIADVHLSGTDRRLVEPVVLQIEHRWSDGLRRQDAISADLWLSCRAGQCPKDVRLGPYDRLVPTGQTVIIRQVDKRSDLGGR